MPTKPLSILNTKIPVGKTTLYLDIAKLHTGTRIDIPVIIQRAKKAGPVLLLIAGIHGDEVNGVEIVRQVIRNKYNKPTAGTIICIPIVNLFGFLNQSREFPDGKDMNRMFPGSKNGSLASRFAYAIMKEIIPHVDYIIDYHTGGDERFNYAQVRLDATDKETLDMARVFGSKFILNSPQRNKSFRKSATQIGKKVLLFEGGKSLDLDRIVTQRAIQGTLRVIQHLGMNTFSDEDIEQRESQTLLVDSTKWIRAGKSGMYRSFTTLGSMVVKGQVLGSISDPFGGREKMVKAPNDGYIICQNHAPIVNQGDALFHITTESVEL
ncbi:MAG: succinylglutamate desuccinylase/aspartoacylase family protein [Bacteroidia bacterium]